MSAEDYRDVEYIEHAYVCLRCGSYVANEVLIKHDVWHAALAATPLIEENQQLTSKTLTLEEQLAIAGLETNDLKESVEQWKGNYERLVKEFKSLDIVFDSQSREFNDLKKRFDLLLTVVDAQVLNIRRNTMDPMKKFYPYLDEIERVLGAVRRPA